MLIIGVGNGFKSLVFYILSTPHLSISVRNNDKGSFCIANGARLSYVKRESFRKTNHSQSHHICNKERKPAEVVNTKKAEK